MSMPFYVSPEQAMRDKAEYARKGIARGRSCVTLQYAGGILLVAPNPSSALHKISEIYDRIAFAAVGRYNEYENLRKAGVTYADITGYQFDRHDVTARGIANWYAQTLGHHLHREPRSRSRWRSWSPRWAPSPASDQIYRITFDGSVTDEPGFVAFGGQADQVSAALKEHYADGMSLSEAFAAALAALSAPGNGEYHGLPAGSGRPGARPRPPDLPPHPRRPARGTHRRIPARRRVRRRRFRRRLRFRLRLQFRRRLRFRHRLRVRLRLVSARRLRPGHRPCPRQFRPRHRPRRRQPPLASPAPSGARHPPISPTRGPSPAPPALTRGLSPAPPALTRGPSPAPSASPGPVTRPTRPSGAPSPPISPISPTRGRPGSISNQRAATQVSGFVQLGHARQYRGSRGSRAPLAPRVGPGANRLNGTLIRF